MVVGVDPSSGEIGPPTREQLETLRRGPDPALDRSGVGLERVLRGDGSQHVDLRGRFRAYSVVQIGADGTARMGCLEDHASALRWVAGTADRPAASRRPFGPREE
jgi:hypothetical protein